MENINNNKNKQENIKQKEELTMNTNEENEIQNITNKFFDALSIETIIGNEINPEIINKMKEIKKKAEEFYQGLKNKDVEIINKYTSFDSNYEFSHIARDILKEKTGIEKIENQEQLSKTINSYKEQKFQPITSEEEKKEVKKIWERFLDNYNINITDKAAMNFAEEFYQGLKNKDVEIINKYTSFNSNYEFSHIARDILKEKTGIEKIENQEQLSKTINSYKEQKDKFTMNNEENKNFTKENQIIPEYVQSQAKRNLGYELTENIYKKYLTEMVENFLAVDENKWNCTKEEKQILLKFKEYKNKNNIEILDDKNINNFLKTDDYTKNKDVISDLYNLVYTPRGERTDEFHFAKQIKEITKTKNNINEQNKNNPFNNLTEGQIVEITIKNKNESSTAYYEIAKSKKGELYLKPYSSDKYKPNTYQDCIANADAFKFNKLENLQNKNIDNVIRKKCFEFYNKNHETSTISAEEFNQYFEIKIKDITKQINKENNTQIEQKKTRKNNNDNSEVKIENYEITTIPQELQDMRKDKKLKPISTGEYTSEILKMLTSFHSIEDRDRNLSDFDKKQLKPILKIFDNKESMKDKQKAFNQFIFDNRNNTELMETIGRIYSKTQRNEYKGYEKKHSNKTKNDRDFILDAIKKNKFPLMNKEEEVNYIKNPINNSLYKGFEQLLLQTNNIVNNLKDTEYISINDLYKNGSVLNPEARMKAQIISNGKNNNGENVYTVVVPCSTTKRLTREERKMLKNLKKEEYRRTVHEAKFKRDFGKLPAFTTSVQPNTQQLPALPNNINLKTEKFTGDIENIEEVLSHDAKNRFICSLTKEPYIPTVDWTKSPHKQELLKFASENPEKLKSISDLAYCNMKQEINEQINKNSKQNEQIEQRVNENQNTNSTKRNRK